MENMTKYELIKDLPTFKKGEVFVLLGTGLHRYSDGLMAYAKETLDKYPNILKDWFREVDDPNRRWKPKKGDEYFYIRTSNVIGDANWDNDGFDRAVNEVGNVFRTEEEAKKALEWLKARKVLFDDAKGFKPNWGSNENNYTVDCDALSGDLGWNVLCCRTNGPGPYFAAEEDAEASIKAHEKEWKIYLLGVEE